MANFYTDTSVLSHYLNHPLMQRIVALRERDFAEKDAYPYAPSSVSDTLDSYSRVLEIIGEICAATIASNAAGTPLSDTSPITIAKLSSSNS